MEKNSRITCSIPDWGKPSSELEKKILFTKNANVFKKPLKSERGLVHIFKGTLFPVRIRHFLTMGNYLTFFQLPIQLLSWCPILTAF